MNRLVKEGSKKGKIQRLKGFTRKVINFLRRRHIWSGLLGGFLWIFSSIFILASQFPFSEEVMWILFFPLKFLVQLAFWLNLKNIDYFLFLIVALLFGMFIGVLITYCIHRIHVWRMHTQSLKKQF